MEWNFPELTKENVNAIIFCVYEKLPKSVNKPFFAEESFDIILGFLEFLKQDLEGLNLWADSFNAETYDYQTYTKYVNANFRYPPTFVSAFEGIEDNPNFIYEDKVFLVDKIREMIELLNSIREKYYASREI